MWKSDLGRQTHSIHGIYAVLGCNSVNEMILSLVALPLFLEVASTPGFIGLVETLVRC